MNALPRSIFHARTSILLRRSGCGQSAGRTRARSTILSWLVGLAVLTTSFHAVGVENYLAVPLGTLGGRGSRGEAINTAGQVVGQAVTQNGNGRAFLHASGTMVDIGTLGGESSFAFGINAHGQVAGHAQTTQGLSHAFLYTAGVMRDLGTLGGDHSYGFDVNDRGEVIGHSWKEVSGNAFIYSNGKMIELNTPDGSLAYAINDAGTIAGYAIPQQPPYQQYAFLYSMGTTTKIGTLDGWESFGHDVNNAGQITGTYVLANGSRRAFLYSDRLAVDLGTLYGTESYGYAINDRGQVTGAVKVADDRYRAFLYSDGAMHDLNSLVVAGLEPGTVLFEANDINALGQIVANGCSIEGVCQAFRLDPYAPDVALEYEHLTYAHYFVSAAPDEIVALESGRTPGWRRTGQSFRVLHLGAADSVNVCRFWSGLTFVPKSSHFHTASEQECAAVQRNPDWLYEGIVFAMNLSDQDGGCAGDSVPLYRLYNQGVTGAPNHRYTTSLSIRLQMIAQGWRPEGAGLGVIGCVPRH